MRPEWPRLAIPVVIVSIGAASAVAAGVGRRLDAFSRHSGVGALAREPPEGSRRATGTLEGVVRLRASAVPGPTRVENTTDPAVCGRSHTLEDLMVSGATNVVANAIVALEDVAAGVAPAPQSLVLDNRDCRFVPHVAVVTAGSALEIVNSDQTLHTVHLYGPVDVNIALPFRGMRITRVLERSGLVAVRCDVHGWMQAYIRVDSHPFHAVTDRSGAFRITGIPPGEYTVVVWHERLGGQKRRVRVGTGQVERAAFDYQLEHPGG